MAYISDFSQVLEVLSGYVLAGKKLAAKQATLERMGLLMDALGNPQNRLKIIHVAGTSGKTSTSYYLADLLTRAGKRVGLTVSPYVDSITERVQVDMKPADKAVFAREFDEFMQIVKSSGLELAYFELLIGFVYWYFDRADVDYAVIETGVGGRFDATNIAQNSDKVCVITDIGLDHTHVLGDSLNEVAAHKAGIIHVNNQVLMYRQQDAVLEIIKSVCHDKNAELTVLDEDILRGNVKLAALKDMPRFQQRNWLLAHEAFELIKMRDLLSDMSEDELSASAKIQIPGRMEEVSRGGKTVIMDGAHNQQKMLAFVRSFKSKYPDTKVPVLISLKLGKELAAVLAAVRPITSKLIVTTYDAGADLPAVAIKAEDLAEFAELDGFNDVTVQPDAGQAYKLLLSSPGDLAVITGSFYLISQLRSIDAKAQIIPGSR